MTTILLAEIAAVIGDPSRAHIVLALLDGRALTAKELAGIAGIAPQTASGHLGRLLSANLLKEEKQGRNKYFRLASSEVARMLEGMLTVASSTLPTRHRPVSKADQKMRFARTCYDHLAGWIGVSVADVMVERNYIVFQDDGGIVTDEGMQFFTRFGVKLDGEKTKTRCMCRPCLDWTERRHHLAGKIGASLTNRMFALGWLCRFDRSRAVQITESGAEGLASIFGLDVAANSSFVLPVSIGEHSGKVEGRVFVEASADS